MVIIGTRKYPEKLEGISISTLRRKLESWEKARNLPGIGKSKKKLCNRQIHRICKRIEAEERKRGENRESRSS